MNIPRTESQVVVDHIRKIIEFTGAESFYEAVILLKNDPRFSVVERARSVQRPHAPR